MDAHDPLRNVILHKQMPRGMFDFGGIEWKRDFQKISAALQPFEVFAPKKRLPICNANRFEQAIAVQKTAIVHRQRRAIERDVLAVNVREHAQLLVTRCRFDQSI